MIEPTRTTDKGTPGFELERLAHKKQEIMREIEADIRAVEPRSCEGVLAPSERDPFFECLCPNVRILARGGLQIRLENAHRPKAAGHKICSSLSLEDNTMDNITCGRYRDKLSKRRDQAAMTLQHIVKEQRLAEQNTDWLDQAAYQSRVQLLDRLNRWYIAEINEIDMALDRIRTNRYGRCLACHSPIGRERLEISPEVEFCASCQGMREDLQRI